MKKEIIKQYKFENPQASREKANAIAFRMI